MVNRTVSADTLRQLLQRMDVISRELERVVMHEREAVNRFDGEALIELVEIRRNCHQELTTLEEQCRDLMRRAEVPDALSLEAFIDLYLADEAPALQAIRRKLYERMVKLEMANQEQSIRLHAAYEVTSGVLQQMGVLEARNTYGPGGAL